MVFDALDSASVRLRSKLIDEMPPGRMEAVDVGLILLLLPVLLDTVRVCLGADPESEEERAWRYLSKPRLLRRRKIKQIAANTWRSNSGNDQHASLFGNVVVRDLDRLSQQEFHAIWMDYKRKKDEQQQQQRARSFG